MKTFTRRGLILSGAAVALGGMSEGALAATGTISFLMDCDTTGIEPLAHPVMAVRDAVLSAQAGELRLRADIASEPNQREANQRSAPSVERGLFLVPKVIE